MKHEIDIEEIKKDVFSMTIALDLDAMNRERKDLRLILHNDEINYIVRHFKDGKLIKASMEIYDLETAVMIYNEI